MRPISALLPPIVVAIVLGVLGFVWSMTDLYYAGAALVLAAFLVVGARNDRARGTGAGTA